MNNEKDFNLRTESKYTVQLQGNVSISADHIHDCKVNKHIAIKSNEQ